MLVVKQGPGQPLVIGDAVLYVEQDGDSIKVSIDAPTSVRVKRGDIIEAELHNAGYDKVRPDTWMSWNGTMISVRQALAKIGKLG